MKSILIETLALLSPHDQGRNEKDQDQATKSLHPHKRWLRHNVRLRANVDAGDPSPVSPPSYICDICDLMCSMIYDI